MRGDDIAVDVSAPLRARNASANARTYFWRPLRGESEDNQPAVVQNAESKALWRGKRTPSWELAGRQTIVLHHLTGKW
jgi:hypothetical protein